MIISAFPGTGKSWLDRYVNVIDLDSSAFHYDQAGNEVPEWIDHYAAAIERRSRLNGMIILISSHQQVRDALAARGVPYNLVYPSITLRDEYRDRYRNRGSEPQFIQTLVAYWTPWVTSCMDDHRAQKLIELRAGEFLADRLNVDTGSLS